MDGVAAGVPAERLHGPAGWRMEPSAARQTLAATGIAAFALLAVGCTYLGLRAARDRVGPLKLHRQRVEDALERIAARPPVFARQGAITALLAQASTRGLPLLLVAGWFGARALHARTAVARREARPLAAAANRASNGVPAPATKSARRRPPRRQRRAPVRPKRAAAPPKPAPSTPANRRCSISSAARSITPPAAEQPGAVKP